MSSQQNSKTISNVWIIRPKPNPTARLRLFCFPYAGGGASVFRTWPNDLPRTIEVCALQLPGRENRLRETPFDNMAVLAQALAQALRPELNVPFAFFGHSLGGLIIFELARQLRREQGPLPARLFVSARRSPQLPETLPPIHQLRAPELVAEVRRRYNGIPQAFLQERELLQLMLPMLRADFALLEAYGYSEEAPLDCPIAAFGGLQDTIVSSHEIAAWKKQTRSPFSLQMFPGGHFYLRDLQAQLLQAIARHLAEDLSRLAGGQRT